MLIEKVLGRSGSTEEITFRNVAGAALKEITNCNFAPFVAEMHELEDQNIRT